MQYPKTVNIHPLLVRQGKFSTAVNLKSDTSIFFVSLQKILAEKDLERDPTGNRVLYVSEVGDNGSNAPFEPTLKIHRGLHSYWSDGEPTDALGLEYNPSFFGGIRIREDATSPKLTLEQVVQVAADRNLGVKLAPDVPVELKKR